MGGRQKLYIDTDRFQSSPTWRHEMPQPYSFLTPSISSTPSPPPLFHPITCPFSSTVLTFSLSPAPSPRPHLSPHFFSLMLSPAPPPPLHYHFIPLQLPFISLPHLPSTPHIFPTHISFTPPILLCSPPAIRQNCWGIKATLCPHLRDLSPVARTHVSSEVQDPSERDT